MPSTELSERSFQLLTTLVSRYIRDGMPVGSKTLAQEMVVPLSAASIRSVMAELEDAGYLLSPHTSAGRVPTDLAYRLFVDSVVRASDIGAGEFEESIAEKLNIQLPDTKLVESASAILSELTQHAGLVLLPRQATTYFRQVEFLPLSNKRVLAILVLNEQEVQNRVIQTDRDYSEKELQKAASFVNEHFSGHDIADVREALLNSMRDDKSVIDRLMQDAIDFASTAIESMEQPGSDYVVAGQANLIGDGAADVTRLRELFEAFQQKKDILHLMERCANGQGVQVFIGEESGCQVLEAFSVVTAPYEKGGASLGVLGVIGPTRMAYEKVVPVVDVTAKLLTAALKN